MYINIYILYVCMCVPRLRFFCLKASLPDDMLSSESMSSSINKPLELSLWDEHFQVELDTEGPHKTSPSLGCSERKGLRMISNVSSSRDSSDIPIDIYIYIYVCIIYIYHVRMYYTHMAMGQNIHFHISWDIVGTASCQGTDGSNGPVVSPSMALTNTSVGKTMS